MGAGFWAIGAATRTCRESFCFEPPAGVWLGVPMVAVGGVSWAISESIAAGYTFAAHRKLGPRVGPAPGFIVAGIGLGASVIGTTMVFREGPPSLGDGVVLGMILGGAAVRWVGLTIQVGLDEAAAERAWTVSLAPGRVSLKTSF